MMAKKIGNLVGKFLEVDQSATNIMDKLLRINGDIDMRDSLKRGTVLKY